jgi:prolyl-tRNA synthetase
MNTKLPNIQTHFSEWYQEVVQQAELADHAPVRGCMVVRPYGWAIWELIKAYLDDRIKKTGHHNAAFPLLIPESFFKKEAEHVAGFSPELAVVTHAGGKKLEEPLIVRPTSETIIHYMFAQWIKSWRDLPLKINQWCSVIRWEMRPRPFLRTTEFFWQEGHTAHQTYQEALQEAELMMQEYITLAHHHLAIPVVSGLKSESEKFPGADKTITFEAIMQDGKALQMGTSHLLSQNFAHSFNMVFQDQNGNQAFPYLTSWAVTTRLIGAIIMVHGDQKGLVLPPAIAPIQVIIIPILKAGADKDAVLAKAAEIKQQLCKLAIRAEIDADEHKTPGAKFYHWELKGVPLRLEIGPRDLAQKQVVITDRLAFEKKIVSFDQITSSITSMLEHFQKQLFERAKAKQESWWHKEAKLANFGPQLEKNNGLFQTGWCQRRSCEEKLRDFKATTRCLLTQKTFDTCFNCDQPSITDVLVAKAY